MKCRECGHELIFFVNQFGMFLKPYWYADPYGVKCRNGDIKYETLEQLIIQDVTEKYRNNENVHYDEDTFLLVNLKKQMDEKEILIQKLNTAIGKINDAFEFGDYSHEEWLKRREDKNE